MPKENEYAKTGHGFGAGKKFAAAIPTLFSSPNTHKLQGLWPAGCQRGRGLGEAVWIRPGLYPWMHVLCGILCELSKLETS